MNLVPTCRCPKTQAALYIKTHMSKTFQRSERENLRYIFTDDTVAAEPARTQKQHVQLSCRLPCCCWAIYILYHEKGSNLNDRRLFRSLWSVCNTKSFKPLCLTLTEFGMGLRLNWGVLKEGVVPWWMDGSRMGVTGFVAAWRPANNSSSKRKETWNLQQVFSPENLNQKYENFSRHTMLLSCGHGWVPNEWKLGKNKTLHFGLPSSISTRACRPAKLYFNISVADSGL